MSDDLATGFKLVVVSFAVWGLPVLVVTLPTVVGAAIMDSGGDAAVFGLMLLLCGTFVGGLRPFPGAGAAWLHDCFRP
ncbi:MAG: hypothetical protein R2856_17155 [Caldilineaceae bacterium]